MKTHLYIFILLCTSISIAFAGAKPEADEVRLNEVVVYAYDSFTADWGPAPELEKLFEEKTGYTCEIISVGDAAQVLSRAVLEKNAPAADVLIGIDNNQVLRAKAQDVLMPYKPVNADSIVASELILDDDWLLTPYDWSHFALIYDTESNIPAPTSLEDLKKPEYAKKIILMDPRTSTPGLGFLAWTMAVYGDDYLNYWKALKPNILTMAPGWDTGYALFTAGEAPLVVSYTTSPAYHVEYDDTDQYKAIIFDEGHIMQIEGAGLVKGALNEAGGKAFLDFLISQEAQAVLPLTQWMNPVNTAVVLPNSYTAAPQAKKSLTIDTQKLEAAIVQVINVLAE